MFTSTFFESSSINNQTRLGLTFFISIVLFPAVNSFLPGIPDNFVQFGLVAVGEALIGAFIGICVSMTFSVYQLAGQYFTVQLGLGASEVFDPMSQISLPLMGQFLNTIALLVFLAIRGPMLILNELTKSFELVTFSGLLNPQVIMFNENFSVIKLFADIFLMAMRISLPIVATLLLVTISTGLLAKAAPQMNLLMIGFPISITVGFIVIMFFLPSFITFVQNYLDTIFKMIRGTMRLIHGT